MSHLKNHTPIEASIELALRIKSLALPLQPRQFEFRQPWIQSLQTISRTEVRH